MEGVGSPASHNTGSFPPYLLISIGGITATALALVAYHHIVKYIMKRRRQRSTISASQTLQFPIGIDEKVLLTIPILAYSTKDCELFRVDQSECAICLGELVDGAMVRLLPNCRHAFHVPCIGSWFLRHNTCPVCRSPVVIEQKSTSGESATPVINYGVRNDERLHRSASSSRVEEKKQLLAITLKRSLSMGECCNYVLVSVPERDDDHESCSFSSTRILRESKSFTARSRKQLDRMSSRVVWSFSQLRLGSRSSSSTTANGFLPY